VAHLASEKGLPVMFHGGVSYTLWRALGTQAVLALAGPPDLTLAHAAREPYKTPQEFEKVAQAFPSVNMIVSHLCKPFFDEMIKALKRTPNLFTDMSGILDSRRDGAYRAACVEQVRKFIGECGPEKMMFGTDFPVQTHEDSIYFVEQAMKDYTSKDKQQVYFDNAHRIIFNDRLGHA
jgi:predicted TIM-barrel fold metal-dependent hydrolase